MKKICFLAFGTFPILSQYDTSYDVGGSELQQVLIGTELVKKGYTVIFIDFDYGQNEFEIVNGIKEIMTFKPKQKINLWEYILHIPTLLNALLKSNADIYYQRTGIWFLPLLYAKLISKPFIYAIPHDSLVNFPSEDRSVIRFLRHFDVSHADHVVVQSNYQKELLKQNFNKNSVLIKSICPIGADKVHKSQTPLVLWVATLRDWKQPWIFLDLAKKYPDVKFCMIGGPSSDTKFFNRIKSEAEKIKNLQFLGFVPLHRLSHYFEKAWIFVNTSTVEGFPNTFFQAWSSFTPVLSLNVDPDEVICKEKLGFHSGNFTQMIIDLDSLLKKDDLRQQLGLNGRHYVEKEHNIDQVIGQYIDLFERIEK
jgi:glycosyltransferase involved in cell wall biosynthesis